MQMRVHIWHTHKMRAMRPWLCLLLSVCFARGTSSLWHTTFCLVTAYRPGETYLPQVIASYMDQAIMHQDGVGLFVVDADNSSGSAMAYPLPNRELAICDHSTEVEGLPSCMVRQRSLDIIGAMAACANFTTGWVVMTEDDCTACPNAIDELVTALSRLHTREISMARFSKFQRATAIPAAKTHWYAQNIRKRLYTHPPDVTRIEDWDQQSGRLYVHDRNLFHHIGRISTESVKNTEAFREKYRALREDVCGQNGI